MKKKLLSLFLVCAMLLTICLPVCAVSISEDAQAGEQQISATSFVDSEGKVNTMRTSVSSSGIVRVAYYIEGVLINIAETTVVQNGEHTGSGSSATVHVTFFDAASEETCQFATPLSTYIETTDLAPAGAVTPPIEDTYVFKGKINYNSYTDEMGTVHADKLYIYHEKGITNYEYRTMNGTVGTAVSILVSVVAAALTLPNAPLNALANELVSAAIYATGVTVIGGFLQGALSKRYYTMTTEYNIRAWDPGLLRERNYDGEQYQLALDGGGYSSEYYYDGYMPWNSSAVAYWMFCDFWAYGYPGVASYT